jgi:hypothetical protein
MSLTSLVSLLSLLSFAEMKTAFYAKAVLKFAKLNTAAQQLFKGEAYCLTGYGIRLKSYDSDSFSVNNFLFHFDFIFPFNIRTTRRNIRIQRTQIIFLIA